jgi:ribosome-associated protein YbcJ (S4-like RNA binding protein)
MKYGDESGNIVNEGVKLVKFIKSEKVESDGEDIKIKISELTR